MGRRNKMRIALAASAAGGVANDRSYRNLDFSVVAAPAVTIFSHAMLAAARFVLLLIAQIEQCRELRIGHRNHIAPMAAIAAIRPAAWHKLLAAKANTPTPAIAGDHADLYFIDEFHGETESVL